MTAPFAGAEDLTPFLVDGEHAETVSIATSSGTIQVTGIFFDVFTDDDGIDSAVQSFLCSLADAPGVSEGNTLTRDDSSAYTIRDVQPDGTGMVTIMVHAAV